MARRLLICIVLLSFCAAAQDVPSRAKGLLARAQQLGSIRAPDSPAFQLKATFAFIGDDLEKVEGTYIETWISATQWRHETVIGNSRDIEVGGPGKKWLVYPSGFPRMANRIPVLFSPLSQLPQDLDFASITPRATGDVVAECALSRPVIETRQFAFCFDKKSGALLEKVAPERRLRNVVSVTCEYGSFHRFGESWVPYETSCFTDRHKTISLNIQELVLEPAVDPSLFSPPAGSIEIAECPGTMTPPARIGHTYPRFDPRRFALIEVWMVVDKKGKPQQVMVTDAVGHASYERLLRDIRDWRFEPAKCDGKPIPMSLTIKIPATSK